MPLNVEADVVALEHALLESQRDLAIAREMLSVALAIANRAIMMLGQSKVQATR